MTIYNRILDIRSEASRKSVFLFGPRQTGKSFLLKMLFNDSPVYNLLHADLFLQLSQRPQSIREALIEKKSSLEDRPVIIDEIQKLPLLLDEVHAMIEDLHINFILTGSSPRKLKRGSANLLGGRARIRHLFPLVYPEIPDYNLIRVCNYGSLPSIYLSDEPLEDLKSYCGNYLKEEIQAEGLVRRIENFSRFLEVAALANGELINFASLASDAGVAAATLREYLSILSDTLVGSMLVPYKKVMKRKSISMAKFYMFDIGVSNILAKRYNIEPKTELFGKAFEHCIHNELRAFLDYARDDRELSFWRDRYGHEVDFIIGDDTAIEVKATNLVSNKHLKNIRMLSEEIAFRNKIIVSLDSQPRRIDDILILGWKEFLSRLWDKAY